MKTKRVQVLMEPAEFQQLAKVARSRRASVADLMRDAAREHWLRRPESSIRARAAEEFLSLSDTTLPSWRELKREIEKIDAVARLFIDTNVFLYAVGGDSPHREPCRDLLLAVGKGALDAVTSSEVLQEILHVRGRRAGIADGIHAVQAAARLVSEVLAVTGDDVLVACELLERHPKLGARDAFHAAVMKNADLDMLVSIDPDFDNVKSLKRISPRDALRLVR